MIYLDTGCLVKLYYPEPDSAQVVARVSGQRLVFTSLHELEMTNALRLKRFHKTASDRQVQAALQLVNQDVANGVFEVVDVDWVAVMQRAVSLADQHTAQLGCRSLDITHCSVALSCGVVDFLSTDTRQCRLAAAAGLRVITP